MPASGFLQEASKRTKKEFEMVKSINSFMVVCLVREGSLFTFNKNCKLNKN